jgi:hypothetical protein
MANNYLSSTYSDEWYTDQDTVDKAIRYLQIKPKSRVICPFDSDKSLFVQTLQKQGHFTMFGMTDFLHSTHYEDAVMETVYQYGKPGLLMLPLDILGGVKRAALYANYGAPKVIVPTRRISYFDSNYVKRKASNFHSVYALFNTGQTGIEWENVTT